MKILSSSNLRVIDCYTTSNDTVYVSVTLSEENITREVYGLRMANTQ